MTDITMLIGCKIDDNQLRFLSAIQAPLANRPALDCAVLVLKGMARRIGEAKLDDLPRLVASGGDFHSGLVPWLQPVLGDWIDLAKFFHIQRADEFLAQVSRGLQLRQASPGTFAGLRRDLERVRPEVCRLLLEKSGKKPERGARLAKTVVEKPVCQFIQDRPDEATNGTSRNEFEWQRWSVAFASSKGPAKAGKAENQDAVLASRDADLVFALCDGVGTSHCARYAAAFCAATFCERLSTELADWAGDGRGLLMATLSATQKELATLFQNAIEDFEKPIWDEMRGSSNVTRLLERKLCENTLAPQQTRSWAPVLATTLMGGFIRATPTANTLHLIRVGDGVAELIGRSEGSVESLLPMDSREMAIEAMLCPGPRGILSIEKAEVIKRELGRSHNLVLSSDGLIRGLEDTVSRGLDLVRRDDEHPARILHLACERADGAAGTDVADLFADNLSLLLIRPLGIN